MLNVECWTFNSSSICGYRLGSFTIYVNVLPSGKYRRSLSYNVNVNRKALGQKLTVGGPSSVSDHHGMPSISNPRTAGSGLKSGIFQYIAKGSGTFGSGPHWLVTSYHASIRKSLTSGSIYSCCKASASTAPASMAASISTNSGRRTIEKDHPGALPLTPSHVLK